LSGLIQEDEVKAEKFLDEMTKVHRYLLRSGEELLVPLQMELKFAESYLYLARERFGESLKTAIAVDDAVLTKTMPPFSMQIILENILFSNALDRNDPLVIRISSFEDKYLSVTNSVHKKSSTQTEVADSAMDNLQRKYEILNEGRILIKETTEERVLLVPLFEKKA
jgi:LytS/YehU family sensor histidine kinase